MQRISEAFIRADCYWGGGGCQGGCCPAITGQVRVDRAAGAMKRRGTGNWEPFHPSHTFCLGHAWTASWIDHPNLLELWLSTRQQQWGRVVWFLSLWSGPQVINILDDFSGILLVTHNENKPQSGKKPGRDRLTFPAEWADNHIIYDPSPLLMVPCEVGTVENAWECGSSLLLPVDSGQLRRGCGGCLCAQSQRAPWAGTQLTGNSVLFQPNSNVPLWVFRVGPR